MRQFLCIVACAAAAAETHVVLHAPDAKRAQPSLAALKSTPSPSSTAAASARRREPPPRPRTRSFYTTPATRRCSTHGGGMRPSPMRGACAACADRRRRVGTSRRANGIVLSNREARKASERRSMKCHKRQVSSVVMMKEEDLRTPLREARAAPTEAITRAQERRLVRR